MKINRRSLSNGAGLAVAIWLASLTSCSFGRATESSMDGGYSGTPEQPLGHDGSSAGGVESTDLPDATGVDDGGEAGSPDEPDAAGGDGGGAERPDYPDAGVGDGGDAGSPDDPDAAGGDGGSADVEDPCAYTVAPNLTCCRNGVETAPLCENGTIFCPPGYLEAPVGGCSAGPGNCAGLDFCACWQQSEQCEFLSDSCICPCDYHCPGEPECVCDCGGGTYLGCQDKVPPACTTEGNIYYPGLPESLPCCPGLASLPEIHFEENFCAITGIEMRRCVLRCGDRECTAGENPCNCPRDCPADYPGMVGAACETHDACQAGICLRETSGYPTGGYCGGGGNCTPWSEDPLVCPPGSICISVTFSQAMGECMATCRSDGDCRPPLTCEARSQGLREDWQPVTRWDQYVCWESGKQGMGLALGLPCAGDGDCFSGYCDQRVPGERVCTAYCDPATPCKRDQVCVPLPNNCGMPGCGGCFYQ